MRFLLFILILIITACQNNTQQESKADCPTSPAAIFSDTMSIINEHSFEVKGQSGSERAIIFNGLVIEVFQDGCEKLSQEFRIIQKGDFTQFGDDFWVHSTAQTFDFLSNSSPSLAGFKQWVNIILQFKPKIKLAEPFYPDPAVGVTIDKIVSKQEAIIIFKIQEK